MTSLQEISLALVTGAAHRIGRALALALARQGFAVLLHYHHSAEDAADTAAEVRSLGVPVELACADLTDAAQIAALFAHAESLPYRLRVLVNSAAVMLRGDVRSLAVDDWDATMDLNLRAPFLCAQHAARLMQSDGGLIVNISDVGAVKSWSGFPAYAVSKAGLEALTRTLARAFAPKIRVNAIAPGLVIPSENVAAEEWERLVGRLPLQRPASMDEIAAALEFIIRNEYVTGQTIVVDGGYSLL